MKYRSEGHVKTRLTSRGEPVQGTTIELRVVYQKGDAESASRTCETVWERAKVVGKGWSRGQSQSLVMVIVEWEDGTRQSIDWLAIEDDQAWRSVSIDRTDA